MQIQLGLSRLRLKGLRSRLKGQLERCELPNQQLATRVGASTRSIFYPDLHGQQRCKGNIHTLYVVLGKYLQIHGARLVLSRWPAGQWNSRSAAVDICTLANMLAKLTAEFHQALWCHMAHHLCSLRNTMQSKLKYPSLLSPQLGEFTWLNSLS